MADKTRVGINGFGRIGRQVLRAIRERVSDTVEIVAVNGLADSETNAHLFKYDSSYGPYSGTVETNNGDLIIDGDRIRVLSDRFPSNLPWGDLGVEIVIESTGYFTKAEQARAHIETGAKKVIISAPATGEDLTIVLGVNDDQYDPANHVVLSNASCTTNCVAPMAKVLHDGFGIEQALMSTIHSYTTDQNLQDGVHGDLRRARAAAMSIIPTSTGAARAVTVVIPELKGKIDGMAYRVPTPSVSVTDLTATLEKSATAEDVNEAYKQASMGNGLYGFLGYSVEPLVSIDYKGNANSVTIDALSTASINDKMVKVVGWYDNEWGYSCRTADLAAFVAAKGV